MMSSIKKYIVIIVVVFFPTSVWSSEDILIDGLISEQVISRVGQLFYENLMNGWQPPEFSGNITVKERPDNFSGNVVWIEINNDVVFEDRVGFIPNAIEDKAKEARLIVEKYIEDNNESLQDLMGIK